MEDPEIPDLLRQLQDAGKTQAAYAELQRYRTAGLTIARLYEREEAEAKIAEEREALKKRLKTLLQGE